MTNRVDYDVAMEIASHEAIIRQAYKDSVGVWTWSVGLTNGSGPDGTRYSNNPQPLEHRLRIYGWALDRYADAVRKAFRGHHLTKAQFAAALSFHWNTGAIGRAQWVKLWKAGNTGAARSAFMSWRKPPEIIGRRTKERDLFFDGRWSNRGTMTEFTRLTSRSTPNWSSGRRINVERELNAALGGSIGHDPIDLQPDPDAPVTPQLMDERFVSDLQKRLKALGYLPGPIDGIYGPKTTAAVTAFQRRENITVDGIAGPETMTALEAAEKLPQPVPDDPGPIKKPDPEIGPAPVPAAGTDKAGVIVLVGVVLAAVAIGLKAFGVI